MITYVNTVLVGTGVGAVVTAAPTTADAGKFVVMDNAGTILTSATAKNAEEIRVGLVTKKTTINKKDGSLMPIIKWSNIIKKHDIKSYTYTAYTAESEDTITVDFAKSVTAAADQNIRVVLRLTFKDLPTRFRKWTETYEVPVAAGSSADDIVDAFVASINVKNANRARVSAENDGSTLVLTAMPYDDDDAVDSISPAAKVRFSANAWYTLPNAIGFTSKNKYAAATIEKEEGISPVGAAKLVRDAEAQAMGYQGILNRGEGTWPVIKPEMNVDLSKTYDTITLEFENMYRAADDIFRKTKQTLQVYEQASNKISAIKGILDAFVKGEHTAAVLGTSDAEVVEA